MVKTITQKVEELISALKEKGIESVKAQYNLDVKYHKTLPWLAQLKYDQIKSDLNKVIPQVCRGIIVDTKDDFKVVALPYTKFFNYGEMRAAKIDWTTARVFEKLDGSIITMYWYQDTWHVASSGLPDASGYAVGYGRLHGKERTKDAPVICNFKMPTDTCKCFMFELLLSKYRNIVQSEDRVVLHGVRDLLTLAELDPIQTAIEHGWECAKIIPAKSLEEVLQITKTLNPNDGEGFVVADAEFNRVKVKSPQYVALSLLSEAGNLNQMRMLEIVRANEGADIFTTVKVKYDKMCADYDSKLADLRTIPTGDTKAFYQKAQGLLPKAPWVFSTCQKMSYAGVRDLFATMDLKRLHTLMVEFEKSEKREAGIAESEKSENAEDSGNDGEANGKKGKKAKGRRKKEEG